MITSLHAIARLAVLAFAGLSLAALTAAQLQAPSRTAGAVAPADPANPWEALSADVRPVHGPVELIHRGDGRLRRVDLPGPERWDYLATSPWVAADGSMEAVGRFSTTGPPDSGTPGEGAIGLVRVRLPGAEVVERLGLEIMPTGRPAWDPARAGHVVFPGSTGKLYSYHFAAGDDPTEVARGGSAVRALDWRCEAPGGREPFLIDPVWSQAPEMRGLLIVSLARMRGVGDAGKPLPISPWWLRLDEEGESIVDAGPLFDPADSAGIDARSRMRFPNVARRDGRLQLVYMLHDAWTGRSVAHAADLEIAPETGRPRVRPGSAAAITGEALAFGTLIPSLDGRSAFASGQGSGVVLRLPLDTRPEAPSLDLARAH
ncbi:hypothetical protein [Paludisphaera soli]|uniref:hypothetical protein n=1 Tax=Paludisphaera soli TaxID=2712865 RepID=UPI0013E9C686|nr:hypothetical protein [Paludisphaera soli]